MRVIVFRFVGTCAIFEANSLEEGLQKAKGNKKCLPIRGESAAKEYMEHEDLFANVKEPVIIEGEI